MSTEHEYTGKPWSLDKAATFFVFVRRRLAASTDITLIENMLVNYKRLKTEGIFLLNTYRKSRSLYIIVTSLLVSGNGHSACTSADNGSQIRVDWRRRVYIDSTQISEQLSCCILQSTMHFIINMRYDYIWN